MVRAEVNGRRTRRARCATIGEEELFKMDQYASKSFQFAKIENVLDQILPRGKHPYVYLVRPAAFTDLTKLYKR